MAKKNVSDSKALEGKKELLLALSAAQKDIDEGRVSPAEPFFDELRKKYGLAKAAR
jgi:hypothetical protein